MTTLLKAGLITLGSALGALIVFYVWATAGSVPKDSYNNVLSYGANTETAPKDLDNQDDFTLVSYNIGYLSGLTNNQAVARSQALFDDNLAAAIATLSALSPDILAVQEIDINSKRSYRVDQVAALAQALGFPQAGLAINWDKNYVPFPYWPPSAHFGKIVSGQAVFSRYPITDNHRNVLEKVANRPFFYKAVYLDRIAQVTEVAIKGQSVIIINVHLEAFINPTRINQTLAVRAMAEDYAQQHPVLLVGDFNSAVNRPEEGERSIAIMTESALFTAALPQNQWPNHPTYPSDTPEHKLDYVFYTPATIALKATRVVTELGQTSDHLPLLMTFNFKE